jgi:hypothetical protein
MVVAGRPREETGGEQLAEAHRALSRPPTGAEAHLLGRELSDTESPESLPPVVCYCFLQGFSSPSQDSSGNYRTVKSLRHRRKQNPTAATPSCPTLSSFLPFSAARAAFSLALQSPARSDHSRRVSSESPTICLRGAARVEDAVAARRNALFRRGGMCNAPEGRGSASGGEVLLPVGRPSLPLCVFMTLKTLGADLQLPIRTSFNLLV